MVKSYFIVCLLFTTGSMIFWLIVNTSKTAEDHMGLDVRMLPQECREKGSASYEKGMTPDTGQVSRRPCGYWASAAPC